MSNYCACSGGDEEYTIELNQQGPEGPQGKVGPEGFSPSISVKTNTEKAYILTVVNKEGNFDTPNLYGELEKLNADLSNIPNPAYINGVSLSSIEDNIPMITMDSSRITADVDGNLILNTTASHEETMEVSNYEVVVNPKEQRLELHDNEGNVKIVATTDQQANVDIATTTTAGIVKPDGSTITVTPDGTISANLSNYVTNDELSVDLQDVNSKIASKLDTATYETDKVTYATKEELASTDATVSNLQTSVASNTTSIGTLREDLSNLETTVGNNSADIAALDADKLEQSNIIAGANITIDRNGNNLTINSIGGGGGGGAAINDSTISSASTWSSSKINSEITTVANTKNDNIFDIGKFNIVGSPTITNDGVASGFSATNLLRTPAIDITKPFKIKFDFVLSATGYIISSRTSTSSSYTATIFSLYFTGSGFEPRLTIDSVNSLSFTPNIRYITGNVLYNAYLEYNGNTTFTLGIKKATSQTYELQTCECSSLVNDTITIGGSSAIGSIDLKQFSITVDGKEVFNGLMESTKPIYDKIATTSTALTTFQTDTDNNFSAVNSALNEKANLSDLAGYVTVNKYNELLARVVALETEINGGNA